MGVSFASADLDGFGLRDRQDDIWRRGGAAVDRGDRVEAFNCFSELVARDSSEPSYHWNLGMALLAMGDYQRGFPEIEWRWHPSLNGNEFDTGLNERGIPRWKGERLEGKSIVIFHEWGFGDSIMMLRYLPMVQRVAKSVTLILPQPLCTLAGAVDHIPDSHFDFRCGLYSLPAFFGVWLGRPYLFPDRPTDSPGRRKVGIAWSGRKTHARDAQRSIDLDRFLDFLNPRDCDLYSLQNTERDRAASCGVKVSAFEDFAATAALMTAMDCIVTVDTAAAHLAGAIGHPNAHVLLDYAQDWRWYRGDDWYPTLKKCRQPTQGDWSGAFDMLKDVC